MNDAPPFDSYNSPEYHDVVGRAGPHAANFLAQHRAELVAAEYGVSAMNDDSGFVERITKANDELRAVKEVRDASKKNYEADEEAVKRSEQRVVNAEADLADFRKAHPEGA